MEKDNKQNVTQAPIGRAYTHPYHSGNIKKPTSVYLNYLDHHPLNFSVVKTAELFHDFIGPEQVSPHYENFMVARKYALGFIVISEKNF